MKHFIQSVLIIAIMSFTISGLHDQWRQLPLTRYKTLADRQLSTLHNSMLTMQQSLTKLEIGWRDWMLAHETDR